MQSGVTDRPHDASSSLGFCGVLGRLAAQTPAKGQSDPRRAPWGKRRGQPAGRSEARRAPLWPGGRTAARPLPVVA